MVPLILIQLFTIFLTVVILHIRHILHFTFHIKSYYTSVIFQIIKNATQETLACVQRFQNKMQYRKKATKTRQRIRGAELRLERDRTATAAIRSNECEEQRHLRLERDKTATASIRSNESEEQRQSRIQTQRTTTASSRNVVEALY